MVTKQEFLKILKSLNLDRNSIIKSSLELAEKGHKNQLRDNGNSYLEEHIYPLGVSIIERYKFQDNFLILLPCALLHDVLEDSEIKESEMKQKVGKQITNIVKILTKTDEENAEEISREEKMKLNEKYLKKVINSNGEAIIIKLEDRLQNLSCITKDTYIIKPEKYKIYAIETEKLFIPLAKKLGGTFDYEKLLNIEIDRINRLFNL